MYIYPDNLKAKPMLWLWELRDIGIIGVGLLMSVFAFVQLRFIIPFVGTAVYAFISIRHDGVSISDFIRFAANYFLIKPQQYLWRKR